MMNKIADNIIRTSHVSFCCRTLSALKFFRWARNRLSPGGDLTSFNFENRSYEKKHPTPREITRPIIEVHTMGPASHRIM